jgi:hypothetical protein
MASSNGSSGRSTADLETAVAAAKDNGDFGPLDGLLAQARQDAPSAVAEDVLPAPVSPYQLAQEAHDAQANGDGPAHAAPEPVA